MFSVTEHVLDVVWTDWTCGKVGLIYCITRLVMVDEKGSAR